MRTLFRFAGAALILVSGWWLTPGSNVFAANLDNTADHVFGQTDFNTSTINFGGLSALGLHSPQGVALDAQGNLYVVDQGNNRVLEYDASPQAGTIPADASADRVFGQPDFTSNTTNNGGVSATSLSGPSSVAVDSQGNLYVADHFNHRVLEYNTPLATDRIADRVFGQPDFSSNTANNGGLSASSLASPFGMVVDAKGNLYVADSNNNRVLFYDTPREFDTTADQVFGQPSFTTNTPNTGGVSASSLSDPLNLALDAGGNLFVADAINNRVLEYNAPPTLHLTADRFFGQPDFTSNTANNGSLSANSLNFPGDVVLDAQGDLYVADTANNRVLEYDTPLVPGAAPGGDRTADRVFGQPNLTSNAANNGGLSASSLNGPFGVALDTQGDLYTADQVNNRVLEYDVPVPYSLPTVSALSPSKVAAGGPALTLTVSGAGFVAGSGVRWNGSDRPTTYLSGTQLNAAISAGDVAGGGPFAVTVFTPAPGGGTSAPINLTLYARAGQDAAADGVLGQPDFTANLANNPVTPGGANRLSFPGNLVIDTRSGRLYISDSASNRVLSWPNAPGFVNGQAADLVLGQPDLSATAFNTGGLNASGLDGPVGVTMDAQGNLYVADTNNNRVLIFTAPLSNGKAASQVFGQSGSFTTKSINLGGISANSLSSPYGVAVDARGNLYIADLENNRVLEYDTPLTPGAAPGAGDTTADRVFGQPDFTSNTVNNGGISASCLGAPAGVALDAQGNLYVADQDNNRVLEYDDPLSAGASASIADRDFGQPDFTSKTINNGGISAKSLFFPLNVALNHLGSLFVADDSNNRVLEYDDPLSAGASASIADRVFGQPDFTSNTANNGGVSANSLRLPNGVALDNQNNLYVADSTNNRVLEYDWALVKVRLPFIMK